MASKNQDNQKSLNELESKVSEFQKDLDKLKGEKSDDKVQGKEKNLTDKVKQKAEELTKKAEKTLGVKPSSSKARHSVWYIIDQVVLVQVTFILAFIAVFGTFFIFSAGVAQFAIPAGLAFLCFFVVLNLFWTFLIIYQGRKSFYELQPTGIKYYNHGFFFEKTQFFPVGPDTEVVIRKGPMGFILNFATLRITSADGKTFLMRRISNPGKYIEELNKITNSVK